MFGNDYSIITRSNSYCYNVLRARDFMTSWMLCLCLKPGCQHQCDAPTHFIVRLWKYFKHAIPVIPAWPITVIIFCKFTTHWCEAGAATALPATTTQLGNQNTRIRISTLIIWISELPQIVFLCILYNLNIFQTLKLLNCFMHIFSWSAAWVCAGPSYQRTTDL